MITIKEQKLEMKKALLKIYENNLDDMPFAVLQDEFDKMEGLLYPCFKEGLVPSGEWAPRSTAASSR
jgi:hypothetical protein